MEYKQIIKRHRLSTPKSEASAYRGRERANQISAEMRLDHESSPYFAVGGGANVRGRGRITPAASSEPDDGGGGLSSGDGGVGGCSGGGGDYDGVLAGVVGGRRRSMGGAAGVRVRVWEGGGFLTVGLDEAPATLFLGRRVGAFDAEEEALEPPRSFSHLVRGWKGERDLGKKLRKRRHGSRGGRGMGFFGEARVQLETHISVNRDGLGELNIE